MQGAQRSRCTFLSSLIKKHPGTTLSRSGMSLFYPSDLWARSVPRRTCICSGRSSDFRICRLVASAPTCRVFPFHTGETVTCVRLSSPITAAGPSPILTRFPVKLLRAPELGNIYLICDGESTAKYPCAVFVGQKHIDIPAAIPYLQEHFSAYFQTVCVKSGGNHAPAQYGRTRCRDSVCATVCVHHESNAHQNMTIQK